MHGFPLRFVKEMDVLRLYSVYRDPISLAIQHLSPYAIIAKSEKIVHRISDDFFKKIWRETIIAISYLVFQILCSRYGHDSSAFLLTKIFS